MLPRLRGGEVNGLAMLSVVIPARNEAASLPQLVEEVSGVLQFLCNRAVLRPLADFEILVVDDGSEDQTRWVLRELVGTYPGVKGIVLARSLGQSVATLAGIRAATGSWIATLDADLQDDPKDLVRLWDALRGYDAALGWRTTRADTWLKRAISCCANWARNCLLHQSIRDSGCSVRIFSRELALRLPAFRGMHRFFGSLMLREKCRIVQMSVRHRSRPHGRSHYNLWNRSLQVIVDLFGVAWLMYRPVQYQIHETLDCGASRSEFTPSVPKRAAERTLSAIP
jgi:glycosyltransferase involved in cell wall biosynthesis